MATRKGLNFLGKQLVLKHFVALYISSAQVVFSNLTEGNFWGVWPPIRTAINFAFNFWQLIFCSCEMQNSLFLALQETTFRLREMLTPKFGVVFYMMLKFLKIALKLVFLFLVNWEQLEHKTSDFFGLCDLLPAFLVSCSFVSLLMLPSIATQKRLQQPPRNSNRLIPTPCIHVTPNMFSTPAMQIDTQGISLKTDSN